MGTVSEIRWCQHKNCKKVIKPGLNRYYIDILRGFVLTPETAREENLPLPEEVEIGDTPLVGPFCWDCFQVYGHSVINELDKLTEISETNGK